MDLKEYQDIIDIWKRKFGAPPFRYDPTTVKTCCKKCGRAKPMMSRHHKSNDFFFALWFPDWFAKRYIEFHPDDCDKLCKDCHNRCHKYFYKMAQDMYHQFAIERQAHTFAEDAFWRQWCAEWRGKFLTLYNKWIAMPLVKRKNPRQRLAAKRKET